MRESTQIVKLSRCLRFPTIKTGISKNLVDGLSTHHIFRVTHLDFIRHYNTFTSPLPLSPSTQSHEGASLAWIVG